jgi:hypothetical protein
MSEEMIRNSLNKFQGEFEKKDLFTICEELLGDSVEEFVRYHCTEEDATAIIMDSKNFYLESIVEKSHEVAELIDNELLTFEPAEVAYNLVHLHRDGAVKFKKELDYWLDRC